MCTPIHPCGSSTNCNQCCIPWNPASWNLAKQITKSNQPIMAMKWNFLSVDRTKSVLAILIEVYHQTGLITCLMNAF